MPRDYKRIAKSKYKYVSVMLKGGKTKMFASSILQHFRTFLNEREAALYVDKVLINVGKPPVNILKPKLS